MGVGLPFLHVYLYADGLRLELPRYVDKKSCILEYVILTIDIALVSENRLMIRFASNFLFNFIYFL